MIESNHILNEAVAIKTSQGFRFGLINLFMVIGLLHLTNLSYYLSKAIGLEVEVNNTGGGAFQFANYVGVAILVYTLLTKLRTLRVAWGSGLPFVFLFIIYLIPLFLSPYNNQTWTLYQILFLVISCTLHFYVQKVEPTFQFRFRKVLGFFFIMSMLLVSFCDVVILTTNNLNYYVAEFNEVFVQSLDDYGIMKQLYGYLLGFLVSYCVFMIKRRWVQIFCIALIAFSGFGIRSFLIGLIGAGLIYYVQSWRRLAITTLASIVGWFFVLQPIIQDLVYDTRFYAYANALDIMQKFPFGVGLGGYHVYTEEYSRQLFAHLFDVNAVLDYIPLAPESDLVFLFGSLGLILGSLHLMIQLNIVKRIYKTVKQQASYQKCLLFFFCFMTFFGISEDTMFTITYWIFFGIASGICYQLHQQLKLEKA